jgi:hypothetical protein
MLCLHSNLGDALFSRECFVFIQTSGELAAVEESPLPSRDFGDDDLDEGDGPLEGHNGSWQLAVCSHLSFRLTVVYRRAPRSGQPHISYKALRYLIRDPG